MQSNQNGAGNIKLSDEAISNIAAIAAKGVDGVVDIDSGTMGSLAEALGVRLPKGIKTDVSDNTVSLEINLCPVFRLRHLRSGSAVQEKVSEAVENMTGMRVNSINININNIRYKK